MNAYEDFAKNNPYGTFFQSVAFGEFQKKIPGRGKVWNLLTKKTNTGCLAIKQKLPFNKCWFWVPYGPLNFKGEFFDDLAKIAKEENAVFARIEPPSNWIPEYTEKLKNRWLIHPAKTRYTPQYTLVINLQNTEEEILKQMKQKGRYNIKIAEKNSVICKKSVDFNSKDFDAFYEILAQTAKRDGFDIHPKYFYKTLLETFGDKNSSLYLAYLEKNVIAGIIVIFYKDTATYYYGGADYRYRALMAPYLLQWTAVKEAKKKGMKFYDFLGIAPPSDEIKNHPWQGVTEFKKKFGGAEISYPPAFEIAYKPVWYKIFCAAKKIRHVF